MVLRLISLATFVQCCYLALQVVLFARDLDRFSPKDSAYGSIYYTVIGVHHAHVLLGILLNLSVLAFVTLRGLTNYWLISVRAIALYWYVVSAIAVVVLFTQLAPSL